MSEQEKIEEFIRTCRENKLSVTPQRLAVYKALLSDHSHPSPEKIHKKVKAEHPTISYATVYKILETFEKKGMISLVTALHNTLRYDPLTVQHHHITCVRCKKVIDLFDEILNEIHIPEEVTASNSLLNFSVHFNVICSECRNK